MKRLAYWIVFGLALASGLDTGAARAEDYPCGPFGSWWASRREQPEIWSRALWQRISAPRWVSSSSSRTVRRVE